MFEDCAEFGFGMLLGAGEQREQLKGIVEQALAGKCESENNEVRAALQEWLDN